MIHTNLKVLKSISDNTSIDKRRKKKRVFWNKHVLEIYDNRSAKIIKNEKTLSKQPPE